MNDTVTDSRLVSYVLNMCIKCKKYGTPFESRVADTVLKQNTWVTKKQWHIVAIGANKKPKAAGGGSIRGKHKGIPLGGCRSKEICPYCESEIIICVNFKFFQYLDQ